ncbi:SPX domain [Sesbania bispinosa]|nr:SPX domain [Sesbania bispinosa]
MTFKKDFKQQMVPEWEKEYMDYEGLKRILKEVKSNKQATQNRPLQHSFSLERAFSGLHMHGSNHQRERDIEDQVIDVKTLEQDGSKQLYETNFQKCHEEGGQAEERFFQKLDEELNKVNAFYKDQVEAAKHEATLLSKQVETLVALRVKVKNPDSGLQQIGSSAEENIDQNHQQNDSMGGPEVDPVQRTNRNTHHEMEAHNNYKSRDPMEIIEHVKIDDALQSPLSTIKGVFIDSNDNELNFNKEKLRKIEEQLRLVFIEFYQKLLHLKDYREGGVYLHQELHTFKSQKGKEIIKAKNEKRKAQHNIFYRPGTELDHREIFLLTTGHAVVAVLCFLINLQLEMNQKTKSYKTATELVPLSLVVLVLLITFCPFNILYRSSRFFFIKCLFRCICAPFFPVTLADYFLADQLTSQFQSFRSFVLYICYYGLGEHSRRQNKCQSHDFYNVQYFIAGILPYWFRLAQCMRQLYEDRDINLAINGSKHLSTIVAMVIRTAFETKKGNTWKVLALVSSAVTVLMSTYWDIVKDWGLLQRHSKNPYLRDKIIVPHKSVYYITMVMNVVLRLTWMQLVLELNWQTLHKVAIITFISCLEIIRRGIWNFFRLENEHLNNVGNYRAFKSVPHPFSYYDAGNDKDD